MRSTGSSCNTCLLTSAVEIRELAIECISATEVVSLGSSSCTTSYCQSPVQVSQDHNLLGTVLTQNAEEQGGINLFRLTSS